MINVHKLCILGIVLGLTACTSTSKSSTQKPENVAATPIVTVKPAAPTPTPPSDDDISFTQPKGVKSENTAEGLKIYQYGPGQKEGDQLSDGFIITISKSASLAKTTLQAEAEKASLKAELVKPIQEKSLNNQSAIYFSSKSSGEHDHYFVTDKYRAKYVQITITIQDPSHQGYDATVKEILSSIQLVSS